MVRRTDVKGAERDEGVLCCRSIEPKTVRVRDLVQGRRTHEAEKEETQGAHPFAVAEVDREGKKEAAVFLCLL